MIPISPKSPARRQFFSDMIPAGALVFLGCSGLLAATRPQPMPSKTKVRFLQDSLLSFKEVFEFAFRDNLIPLLQNMKKSLGAENFIALLKQSSSEYGSLRGRTWAQTEKRNDLAAFGSVFKSGNRFWTHSFAYEILEHTGKILEVKYTECLFADVFREAGAPDIGFAAVCYADFAVASAFNAKLRLTRTKTLMEGQDCCNHRYALEA